MAGNTVTNPNTPEDVVDNLVKNAAGSGKTPRRRQIPLWWTVVAIVILLGVAAFLYTKFTSRDAPIPANVGAEYAGIEQGFTERGFARLGSGDAPVLVEEFASYACPHCRDFHVERFPAMLDEIAAGQVQFVMIPVPHIGSGAKEAAAAAFCAGQQGQYWEMNDVLFDWQKRFVAFTIDKRRLHNGAQNLGLDTSAFDQCMDSKDTDTLVESARTEFNRRGLSGTPTFFINGEQVRDYAEFDNLAQLAESLKP
jgi:protein-disulfide isomerase